MQIGAIFPQVEIDSDPRIVRRYAETVEALGFDHLLAYDHVIGADLKARPPGWAPPGHTRRIRYTLESRFLEPLTLFSYLAGITTRLQFASAVLILGQRQTVLVAKQAAVVDVLSGGRLRLGVGTGWNPVEYEALGMNFHDRGARSEEQIALLRELWTKESLTFQGRWHTVTAAGINPMPVQRPIPIWFGGWVPAVLRRIGRIGDGWFAGAGVAVDTKGSIRIIREAAAAAGRDPASIAIEGAVAASESLDEQVRAAHGWNELGATHLCLNTMEAGFGPVDEHLEALSRFRAAMVREGLASTR